MEHIAITWLGHACFLLEAEGYRILLDPYEKVPGLPDVTAQADAVYCSHGHFDHAYLDGVTLTSGRACPFTVREVETFHDDAGGSLRGHNTVRCFTAGGVTVVHLGDLGHQLTPEQASAIGPCHAVLVPVGGTYTLDARGAYRVCRDLGAPVIVPMHFRRGEMGFPELGTLDAFTDLFPPEEVKRYPGSCLEVSADAAPQVAVLTLDN